MIRQTIQKQIRILLTLIFSSMIIGIGCSSQVEQANDTTTAVSTPNLVANNDATPAEDVTVPPTITAVSTSAFTEESTATPIPTSQFTPTYTPIPTDTAVPTITPTSQPQATVAIPLFEPSDEIPTPVPEFTVPENATTIVLLGNDGGVNTDTIIVVAINRNGPTASILSLPRDLYVYIPEHGMSRLNTVMAKGGPDLLKQTIQYNFGIPIHFYAQIDFEGFKSTVDILDGVDVAVSCQLRDWRLKSPELDVEEEDNWEQFTLEPGIHKMDGDLALWYARSRLTTSDFDRGRRQQQLLRAMFNQAVDVGLITEFPSLWNTYKDYVNTDMDIGRILQIASLAPAIRENGVQHLYVAQKTEPFISPEGWQVQLPIWEGERMMEEELSRLFLPPALNMAAQAPIEVEIINGTGDPDLAALAADNLAWFGFTPVFGEDTAVTTTTTLDYFKPNFKGSYDWLISWVFAMRKEQINLVEDEAYTHNYKVTLGTDYNPCRPLMLAPQLFLNQSP